MPTTFEMRQALHQLCPHNTTPKLPKIRLVPPHDGGYVIIDDLETVDTLLSFGIGGNIDFEYEMTMRGIKTVIMCDHTIESLPREHPSFVWHKRAVSGTESENTVTIESLIKSHNLHNHRSLFLKCDIEDTEWEVIENTPSSVWEQFSQLVFEFHFFEWMRDPERLERMRNCWSKLSQTHACVHVHGNTHGPLQLVNGISIPQCLEITYLRRDRADLVPSWEIFPTSVDTTNHVGREDYFLGSFRFF